MKSMRYLVCGAALVASFVGASSASAANWDPQGVELTATSTTASLTDASGNTVHCNTADALIRATGDLATTTPIANPVAFGGGCSSPLGANTATVTTFGTWEFTAVNTTTVNASATGTGAGGTGPVADINIGGICTVTVDGPATINGNTWNNATHQLTINNAATFTLTPSAGCFGLISSPGRLDGTFTLPASAIIT
jgi:hypothetical protein